MLTRFDLVVAMELGHAVRISEIDEKAGRNCVVLALLDPEGGHSISPIRTASPGRRSPPSMRESSAAWSS